jgi:hypothetical protein
MTPQEVARVDQARAGLLEAANTPCACGDCATPEQIHLLLSLDDEVLLEALT